MPEKYKLLSLLLAISLLASLGIYVVFTTQEESPNLQKYMDTISQLRGLEFEKPVPMKTIDQGDLRARLENEINKNYPLERIKKIERALQSFELFPEGENLRDTILDLYSQQIIGFYDPEEEIFYTTEVSKGLKEYVIVHELTHALQDQHFNLDTLRVENENNDDLSLAIQALYEGGAQYVTQDYLCRKIGSKLQDVRSLIENNVRRLIESPQPLPGTENFPLYLTKILEFPYNGGLLFVMEGWTENWGKINKAYDDLPASTEQILHPEKYFEDRDHPTILTLPNVKPELGEDWILQENNKFGEYQLWILLMKFFQETTETQNNLIARNGWDGDSYLTYYNEDDDVIAIIWLSTWDSIKDASEFNERYQGLLGEKYPDAEIISRGENSLNLGTSEGEVLLEQRGKDVLILERIPPQSLESIATKIWGDTKRCELRNVERI